MPQSPQFLFVDVNRRCKLRCQHRRYWKNEYQWREGDISILRRSQIIGEFCELNPRGTVVICGGESILDLDEYFAVTTQCADLGLKCFSV